MNLQEAYEKAKKEMPDINHYTESEKAFTFNWDDGQRHRGGDSMPIVVPKDGSPCLNMLYALQETDLLDGDIIAEGSI